MSAQERGATAGVVAEWIASGHRPYGEVLRGLGDLLVAMAEQDGTERTSSTDRAEREGAAAGRRIATGEGTMTEATTRTRDPFAAPPLPEDPNTEDIALMLANARARAHELIDQSVARAQETLDRRAPDGGMSPAQREAQRLALERLRRSVSEVHSDIRALHARLDGIEALLRNDRGTASGGTSAPARTAPATPDRTAAARADSVATPTLPIASTARPPAAATFGPSTPRATPSTPSVGTSAARATAGAVSSTLLKSADANTTQDTSPLAAPTEESTSASTEAAPAQDTEASRAPEAPRIPSLAERTSAERAQLAEAARASLAAAALAQEEEDADTSSARDIDLEPPTAQPSTATTDDDEAAPPAAALAPPSATRRIEDAVSTALSAARSAAMAVASPGASRADTHTAATTEVTAEDAPADSESESADSSATANALASGANALASEEVTTAAPRSSADTPSTEAREQEPSTDRTDSLQELTTTPDAAGSTPAAAPRPASLWTPPTIAPPTPARPSQEATAAATGTPAASTTSSPPATPPVSETPTEAAEEVPAEQEHDARSERPAALRSEMERIPSFRDAPKSMPEPPPSGVPAPLGDRRLFAAASETTDQARRVPAEPSRPRFGAPVRATEAPTSLGAGPSRSDAPDGARAMDTPAARAPLTLTPPTRARPESTTPTDMPANAPASPSSTEATPRPADATREASTPPAESTAFAPEGALMLRVSPISGFQGLMRVQDAVSSLDEVREAAVEAYARGEAQLRVVLSAPLEPEEVSRSLTASLGQQARIEFVSIADRSLRVALG